VKSVRVGVLSSISKLDPRESADHVSAQVLAQVFDTPYVGSVRALRGTGVLAKRAAVEVRGERVWFTLAARNPRFELTRERTESASCEYIGPDIC
jgi:hypothetical protein